MFSVTTSIHPTHLGLGPDPLDGPSFGLGLGEGTAKSNNPHINGGQPDFSNIEEEEGAAPSYLASILENLVARGRALAAKLGNIRNPPPSAGGEGQLAAGGSFQCMKSLEEPVMVEGQPVLVAQPEDCYQARANVNKSFDIRTD